MSILTLLIGATLGATDAPFTVAPGLLLQDAETPTTTGEETVEGFTWGGNITAGLTILAGNSKSTAASLDAETVGERGKDRITLKAGWRSARQEDPGTGVDSTTARRLFGSAKYDRFFTEDWYAYILGQALKDGVADIDLLWTVSVGAGYQWIKEEGHNLSTEAGLGYTDEDFGDNDADKDYMSARAALHYDKALSETSEIYHDSQWVPSLKDFNDDQIISSTTGLRAKVMDDLFADAKVVWLWNSSPAEDRNRQDVTYIFGLTWTF